MQQVTGACLIDHLAVLKNNICITWGPANWKTRQLEDTPIGRHLRAIKQTNFPQAIVSLATSNSFFCFFSHFNMKHELKSLFTLRIPSHYFIIYAFRRYSRICIGGLTNLVSAARSGGVSRSDCRHVMKITTPYELRAFIWD